MSVVTLPYTYSINDVQFENTWTYDSGRPSLPEITTATVDTDMSMTINSYNEITNVINVTIYSQTNISRSAAAIYPPGVFTYTAAPIFTVTRQDTAVSSTVYSSSGSTTVGNGGNSNIIFSTTFNHTLPSNFLNRFWTITLSVTASEVTTGRSDPGSSTSGAIIIPKAIGNAIFFGMNF
jgi:hypothetical protein